MKEEQRVRVSRLIDGDRREMNEESAQAAKKELERIAEEFFETDGKSTLTVERGKRDFFVTFTFSAKRVKNFSALKNGRL